MKWLHKKRLFHCNRCENRHAIWTGLPCSTYKPSPSVILKSDDVRWSSMLTINQMYKSSEKDNVTNDDSCMRLFHPGYNKVKRNPISSLSSCLSQSEILAKIIIIILMIIVLTRTTASIIANRLPIYIDNLIHGVNSRLSTLGTGDVPRGSDST